MHPVTQLKVWRLKLARKVGRKTALALLGLGCVGSYLFVLLSRTKKKMGAAAESTKASADRIVSQSKL